MQVLENLYQQLVVLQELLHCWRSITQPSSVGDVSGLTELVHFIKLRVQSIEDLVLKYWQTWIC